MYDVIKQKREASDHICWNHQLLFLHNKLQVKQETSHVIIDSKMSTESHKRLKIRHQSWKIFKDEDIFSWLEMSNREFICALTDSLN